MHCGDCTEVLSETGVADRLGKQALAVSGVGGLVKQHSAAMMGEEYIGSDGTECARLRYRSIRSVCV